MTREALREGLISEDTITTALLQARGDLFLSACYLGVTARELDSYVRSSSELQGFVAAIEKVKRDPDYEKLSVEAFEDRLDVLTRAYRVEAIDIIHDLATMPFDTAAMADVKLKAAIELRGRVGEVSKSSDQAGVLMELNQLYHSNAQRIKTIRAVQIEFSPDEASHRSCNGVGQST